MDTVTELPTNRVLEKRIEALTDAVSQLLAVLHVKGVLEEDDLDEFEHGASMIKTSLLRNTVDSPSVGRRLRNQAVFYAQWPGEREQVLARVEQAENEKYEYIAHMAAKARQAAQEGREGG